MSAQELALAQVARLLDRLAIPYMIIGGQANIIWGEPRATLDIDLDAPAGSQGCGESEEEETRCQGNAPLKSPCAFSCNIRRRA